MPLLKRKAVEDLAAGKDALYSRARNVANAGTLATDTLIQRLLRHRVPVVTVIVPSREEAAGGMGKEEIERIVREKEGLPFALLRNRLFESCKKIYKPYSELINKAFWGKLGEKLIKADFLLERKPDILYRQGIFQRSGASSARAITTINTTIKKLSSTASRRYSRSWRPRASPASSSIQSGSGRSTTRRSGTG
jgi:hypothetical protein